MVAYGNIDVDGSLEDWKIADRLDYLPNTSTTGYEVYGKYAGDNYVFAINSALAIGAGTSIWLNTDQNQTTGLQIFGFAGGAEFNIQVGANGMAKLYSVSEGTTLVSDLESASAPTAKAGKWPYRQLAREPLHLPRSICGQMSTTPYFYPATTNSSKFTVTQTPPPAPKTTYGNIELDGNLTDWAATDRLDFLPGSGQAGYQIYGKSTVDGYAFALNSAIAVGNNTTIWLDTDRNITTGYQVFPQPTGRALGGAEYSINIVDGNAYLYQAQSNTLQTPIAKVDAQLSADGKTWEVAIDKNLLPVTGPGIDVLADVNDSVFLPGDYDRFAYHVSNVALPERTDLSKKVGIVYSETSANRFFDRKAYTQLFANAQNQAMQAGIDFDLLTENDLKDLSKVVQYDSLIFPYFANVRSTDVSAIENVLTQASYKFGVGLIAAGDFMTNDETGAALAGNPYQRMHNLFDINRTGGGAVTGEVSVNITDPTNPILGSNYSTGEQLVNYSNNLSFSAYSGLHQAGTILANQTVNNQSYNAVIATETGGRNLHFADPSIFADSNLGWQGIDWSVYGTGVKVGLDMTRNQSMFISRDDVDQSMFADEAPAIAAKLGNILADWKTKYNFVGSHYINIGNNPTAGEFTDWSVMQPIYQQWLDLGNEIGTHSYTHPEFTNNLTAQQLKFEFQDSKEIIQNQLGVTVNGAAIPGNPESLAVDRVDHARKFLVDAEKGAPRDDRGIVHPADARPHDSEFALFFQAHGLFVRDREGGGLGGELSVGEASAACEVHDLAFFGGQFRGRDVPRLGRRLDQHDAGRGAGHPHPHVIIGGGPAAPGELRPDVSPQTGLRDHDGAEIGIELVGHDHRQVGLHALAGLRVLREDRDDIFRGDRDEGIRRELSRGVVQEIALGEGLPGEQVADGKAAAREGGDAEKIATGDGRFFHLAASTVWPRAAASLMAARMRT